LKKNGIFGIKNAVIMRFLNCKIAKRCQSQEEIKELVKNYKITGNIQQTRGLIDRTFTSLKKIDGDQAHPHGLRHEYAHFRYYQITGMTAPAAGGLKYAEMDANQRKLYHNACKIIAVELGHSRETISRAYVGK
jgi:integrase